MSSVNPSSNAYRVSDLPQNRILKFDIRPDPAQNEVIARELALLSLRKLRFAGKLQAWGKADWRLTATLGASVVQPCTVTLEPVTTRIDQNVERKFIKDFRIIEADEIEMPEDDTIEALGTWIDLEAVMIEALSLALPDYPRREGAQLGTLVYTRPGERPMSDADARPFAGLAALKNQLASDSDEADESDASGESGEK